MDKRREIYDEISALLKLYETDESYDYCEEMYDLLVKIQNSWEGVNYSAVSKKGGRTMTTDITVNGKAYEMTISFRKLINDGATSVSMDEEDAEVVCAKISGMMAELERKLDWLNFNSKNLVEAQKQYVERAYAFISDINHVGVFHNV